MHTLESLEESPKYIRYDFFMAIIGLFIFYFVYTNGVIYNDTTLRPIALIIGGSCLVYGVLEMKRNYDTEMELRDLQLRLEKRRLGLELKKSETTQANQSQPTTKP